MIEDTSVQRISRLTPLKAVLALIEAQVSAVAPQRRAIVDAERCTLAEDVVSSQRPAQPIALRDGYAVAASAVADAGPYAPAILSAGTRVDVGEPMPAGTDAVLPLDAVVRRGEYTEAVAAVAPGEGVLPEGGDADAKSVLRRAGERMRSLDLAVMQTADIEAISVREPRIAVVSGGQPTRQRAAVEAFLVRSVIEAGAKVSRNYGMLEDAVSASDNDAIIVFGGTGSGRRDSAVHSLARLGRKEIHGIAISPGETTALGFAGTRPVLLVPGRLDSAIAVWHLIGRPMAAKLSGGSVEDNAAVIPLERKVTSVIGMSEVVPVSCSSGMAEPLASGYLSFMTLSRSDGWIVVPAENEGFAAGTPVAVNRWP